MNASTLRSEGVARYELRYQSLFNHGRGYAFPCDAEGRVDIDALNERLRVNYLYAHMLVGQDFSVPAVCVTTVQ